MKKIALILATLVAAVAVQAAPVDPARAHKAAENLLGKAVVDVTPKDFSGCYLFAGADGVGFVLLTDDDRLRPLLALSPDGLPPVGDLPPNLAQWLDAYQRDITAIKAGQILYGMMLYPDGGTVDDLLVYRVDETTTSS